MFIYNLSFLTGLVNLENREEMRRNLDLSGDNRDWDAHLTHPWKYYMNAIGWMGNFGSVDGDANKQIFFVSKSCVS